MYIHTCTCSSNCNCFDLGIVNNHIYICVYQQKEENEQVLFSNHILPFIYLHFLLHRLIQQIAVSMQQTAMSVSDDYLLLLLCVLIILTFRYNIIYNQLFLSLIVQDDILEPDTRYETVQLSVRTQYGHSQDEMDANSTISPPTVSGEGPPLDSAPSLPPPRSRDTDPVYTEAIGSKKVTQQPTTEGIVYDDIKAFQN